MAATHSTTTSAELRAPKTPTGPRGRPLLGNLLEFRWNNLDFVVEVGRDYGDVACFRLANRPMYQVNHPDGIKHVLQDNHRNYNRDNISFTLLKPALGNGLLVTDGDFWLRQRRLMQPAFHRQRIAAFGSLMVDAAVALLGRWEAIAARRTAVNVADEMMAVTLSIATKTLFSTDISAEVEVVRRATAVITEDFMFRLSTPFYPSLNVPTLRNRRFAATMREIDRVVYGIIAERRRSGADPGDLLSMLMEARDEESGAAMDDRQLRDEVITLLMAGHETTAVAMTWVWYLLSRHPAVQQRLHQELAEVLGRRTPTLDDLPKLKYTRMVIDETMRLYPPAYYSSRNAVQDDEICGYHIPAGAFVGISPYV
ncbi:MAG TPA: cytochrome P450, partial [Ardenticatenaceae bacterium]|nr:cytochrome P450 [Ardenticatenaceae bacterium]